MHALVVVVVYAMIAADWIAGHDRAFAGPRKTSLQSTLWDPINLQARDCWTSFEGDLALL